MKSEINLGILGLGVVGSGTVQLLQENKRAIERIIGAKLNIKKIAVRDLDRKRNVSVDPAILTTNPCEIVDDPEIDIICELMGGVDPAKKYVLRAMDNGKQIVTANKELIAKEGSSLMHLASHQHIDFQFEGSVGGGIPIIQPMKNALAGNRVDRVMGIVNGTTNYILTQMSHEGAEFGAALASAQEQGFAETDPSSDIDGHDAAYKLAILSSIAFTSRVEESQVYREGISQIQARDIKCADELGYIIKLLGIAKLNENGAVEARVHPTLLPKTHPLASVSGVYNAILVHGNYVGDVMFYGRGAGGRATASAVVGDIIDTCRNLQFGTSGRVACTCFDQREVLPIEQSTSAYYFRMVVRDRPKALSSVANVFGNCGVSIEAIRQKPLSQERSELVWITHITKESFFTRAMYHISQISITEAMCSWFRVEQ